MRKEQKNTLWKRVTDSTLKRTAIVLFIVVGIPLIGYGAAEFSYQMRIQKLTSALGQIGKNEIESRGGQSLGSGVDSDCTYVWDAFWAIDSGPCPRAGASWWIPLQPGEEADAIVDILSQAGYEIRTAPQPDSQYLTAGARKNGVSLMVQAIITDSHAPKQALPEGKQWVRLNLGAQESN